MEPITPGERFVSHLNDKRYPKLFRPLLRGDFEQFTERIDLIDSNDVFKILTNEWKNGNTLLHITAQLGNAHAVKKMIACIPSGNHLEALIIRNSKGLSLFHIVAEKGDVHTARALIDGVSDRCVVFELLKQKTVSEGYTALHLASANGHFDFIKYILASQCLAIKQVNELLPIPDKNERHPVNLAANSRVTETFEAWKNAFAGKILMLQQLTMIF